MSKHPDVVVVGGGIIGLSVAYFLANDGASVTVLDRGDLGAEASWAGAGILPPGNPDRAATHLDKLRAIGSAGFAAFSAELRERTGIDNGYRRCGGIEFLQPEDEGLPALWKAEGIAVYSLTREGVARLEPALAPVPGPAFLLPDTAQVRNPWHLRALIAACRELGVNLRPHTPVAGWERGVGRVVGARLGNGDIVTGGRYLLAAGAWSEAFLELLGQAPHLHPVRGQIVLFKHPRPGVLGRVLTLGKEYLVPRGDGRILVGSTEEPEASFEKGNTPDGVAKLRELAVRTVPALGQAEVEKCWSGLRPGSPDGLPFLGGVPGWADVFVAAGHFRAGVQLSLGTGRAMAELMTGKEPCVPLDAFRLDRTPGTGPRPMFRS
jgi:glycine oxidase